MTIGSLRAISYMSELVTEHGLEWLKQRLSPKTENLPPHVPRRDEVSEDAIRERWNPLIRRGSTGTACSGGWGPAE